MAIDTRQKRMSAINVSSPWRGPMIVPTVLASQAIRQAAAFMYSGVLAGEPTSYVPYQENTWIAKARPTSYVAKSRPSTWIGNERPTTWVPDAR